MSDRKPARNQPEGFAFTEANAVWARKRIKMYPSGRQASAIIPLLWKAQEQEGWLTLPAIQHVAELLGMAQIRALEVASFYFMFQLQPVGSEAHIQVCGTTPCMLCGSEALLDVCREEIAPEPHTLSSDGKLSWEEVECLAACSNAPMVQVGKDYFEDLTPESLRVLLAELRKGERPRPGSAIGRFSSEPSGGATSLTDGLRVSETNASVELAMKEAENA